MLSESPALKARYIFRASLLISPRSSSPASHPRDESVSRITNCNLNERPLAVRRDTDPRTKRMGECSYATLVLLMTTINLPNLRTGPLLGPNASLCDPAWTQVDAVVPERRNSRRVTNIWILRRRSPQRCHLLIRHIRSTCTRIYTSEY
jgi:hypothetical protein